MGRYRAHNGLCVGHSCGIASNDICGVCCIFMACFIVYYIKMYSIEKTCPTK